LLSKQPKGLCLLRHLLLVGVLQEKIEEKMKKKIEITPVDFEIKATPEALRALKAARGSFSTPTASVSCSINSV